MTQFTVELDRETDGRWIAEIPVLPGALCYGASKEEASRKVEALALRVGPCRNLTMTKQSTSIHQPLPESNCWP